jgi:hypothetical protein
LKPLVSAKISIFLGIKIRVKSSFFYPVFGRSGCRLSNSTAIFRIKKLNILPLVIYMVHDYSFFGSIADFVIKKGTFRIFTGFGHLQMLETLGRNMAVELDSRHPLLPYSISLS